MELSKFCSKRKDFVHTPFEKLYVPCKVMMQELQLVQKLYLYNHILNKDRLPEIKTAYFGRKSSEEEIITCLNENIKFERLEDEYLFNKVSDKLINGGVVGWFQGRVSLDQERWVIDLFWLIQEEKIKDLLNKKIKRRRKF